MKIFKISSVCQNSIEVFCEDKCLEVCAMSKIENDAKVKIAFLKQNEENCYRLFQLKISNNDTFMPFFSLNECLQIAIVSTIDRKYETPLTLTLDSAAQASVMSLKFLNKHFPGIAPQKTNVKVRLIAADDKPITYMGFIEFYVQIKNTEEKVVFYIIKEGCMALLGLPQLISMKIKVDFGTLITGKNKQSECRVLQITNESDFDICGENNSLNNEKRLKLRIMQFTLKFKTSVEIGKPISITLISLEKDINSLIYSRALIFDCSCISSEDLISCEMCRNIKPCLSSVIYPDGTIQILYVPPYSSVLEPNIDIFTGIVNPTYEQYSNYMNTQRVHHIRAEGPGIVNSGPDGELVFEPGFINENEEGYTFKDIQYHGPLSDKSFQNFVDYNITNICTICKNKGYKYFCKVSDVDCNSVQFFNEVAGCGNKGNKCQFISSFSEDVEALIIPAFMNYSDNAFAIGSVIPHIDNIIKENISNHLKLHILSNEERKMHFIITGRYPCTMEILKFITTITNICRREKISKIGIIGFDKLQISRAGFEDSCVNFSFLIYLIDHDFFIQRFQCSSVNLTSIKKIKASSAELVSELKEKNVNVGDLLNILIEDNEIIYKLKALANEMSKQEGKLTSLWSPSTGGAHRGLLDSLVL